LGKGVVLVEKLRSGFSTNTTPFQGLKEEEDL